MNLESNERLIEKFLTDPAHITIWDCDRILVAYGFVYRKSGGSHRGYHKKGEDPINVVVPKRTKYVKPGYVNLIIRRLHLEA